MSSDPSLKGSGKHVSLQIDDLRGRQGQLEKMTMSLLRRIQSNDDLIYNLTCQSNRYERQINELEKKNEERADVFLKHLQDHADLKTELNFAKSQINALFELFKLGHAERTPENLKKLQEWSPKEVSDE